MSPPALEGMCFGRAPIALGVPVDLDLVIFCTDLPMGGWIMGVWGMVCSDIWTFLAREGEVGITALSGPDDTGTATVGVAKAQSLVEDIMQ